MQTFKIIIPIMAITLQMTLAVPLSYPNSENSTENSDTTTAIDPNVFITTLKQSLDLTKDLIQRSEDITKNVLKSMEQLKDVNTSQTYQKYKKDLEKYLKTIDHYKTVPGSCLIKSSLTFMEFVAIIIKFVEEMQMFLQPNNLSSEDLEMKKLFQQHGLRNLINDLLKFQKTVNFAEYPKSIKNMEPETANKYKDLLKEQC